MSKPQPSKALNFCRRKFMKTISAGTGAAVIAGIVDDRGSSQPVPQPEKSSLAHSDRAFPVRICFQDLPLRLWYRKDSLPRDDKKFWDKDNWDRLLKNYAQADRKSTSLNSSHIPLSRMPSS